MKQVAKIFTNGSSQAVRLPAAFRYETNEVFIRRDEFTGDVILSRKPGDWDGFLAMLGKDAAPRDFLGPRDREQALRDPLEGADE